MATPLIPKEMIWGSLGIPRRARTPLGPIGLKMGLHFLAKSVEILELSSIFGLPGILQWIQPIYRKWSHAQQLRGTPSQTVVNKLLQKICIFMHSFVI